MLVVMTSLEISSWVGKMNSEAISEQRTGWTRTPTPHVRSTGISAGTNNPPSGANPENKEEEE
jgi:hypothetical protein